MPYTYSPPPGGSSVQTQKEIAAEFRRWNEMSGDKAIGEFDFPPPSKIGGKEAIVRFEYHGQPRTVSCDRWDTYAVNLKCIALVLKERRLAQARGIADLARQMFDALPPPAPAGNPYDVLGVKPGDSEATIRTAYRAKAQAVHPDKGGTHDDMVRVSDAWAAIRRERGWR